MRIIGGRWRGRALLAPSGDGTRPTAERVRQALFDMLVHAPWGGIDGRQVLDAFAGTGALGLEALSRGAAMAHFIEADRRALAAIGANIAACRAEAQCRVQRGDALAPPRGVACDLVFLDPPYGRALVGRAVAALAAAGWIAPAALLVAELGREEEAPWPGETLAERAHGRARLVIARYSGAAEHPLELGAG